MLTMRVVRSAKTALLAALLCGGCATTLQGGAAADDPRVDDVVIHGNREVKDDDIAEGLVNRPPSGLVRKVYRRLDRLALEQDVARIESYYQRRGFFSAKVVGNRIEPTPVKPLPRLRGRPVGRRIDSSGVRVVFNVREGEPTRVTEVSFDGLPPDLARSDALAEKTAALERGEVFHHERYVDLKSWIMGWLARQGYPHATVRGRVEVDRDRRTAAIRMVVDRGPKARFGATDVRGLDETPSSAVYDRLAYDQGDEFDPARLELTQGRLYQLGLFSAVRMDFDKIDRPEVTDVRISITEAKRHDMRLGGGVRIEGGFSADELQVELRARADYVMRRFLHPLATLRIDARPAWQFLIAEDRNGPAGEATATMTRADLFAPLLTGSISVGYQADEYEAYALHGPLGRLGLSRPFFRDRLLVGLSYRFRDVNIVDSEIDPITSEAIGLEDYRVGAVEESIVYDLRDHPIDPSRGFFAQLVAAQGSTELGGTTTFTRATGEVRGYLPVGRRLVLAVRGLYGRRLRGQLPITERFFGGGASGHRGFGFRELSPEVLTEDGERAPIGGEELVLASGEARVHVTNLWDYPFGVVGFFDAGDVTYDVGAVELDNLHHAVGLGLRYDPIISVRFDVGYRLNRTDHDDWALGRFAFHFSLGQAF